MEKIINKLINESTKGVDTYTHNGSTWLIFTESKQWVIELTEGKTLWYNFNFFKNLFAYASLEVVQNQHLITKWVEDNVMNAVKETFNFDEKHTLSYEQGAKKLVEDTIENGVKETKKVHDGTVNWIGDIIENGVKETCWNPEDNTSWVEGVIKGGVKETRPEHNITEGEVDDIIQDGVKRTMPGSANHFGLKVAIQDGVKETELHKGNRPNAVENTIENGIKETKISPTYTEYGDWLDGDERLDDIIDNGVKLTLKLESREYTGDIDDTLENGVKETKTPGKNGDLFSTFQWMEENKTESVPKMIDDIIENGIKEIKPLPSQTGNKDWSEYSHGREDRTKPFNDYLNDTLEMGVKIK